MNNAFQGMTTEQVQQFLRENQFELFRQLETGEWVGVMRLAFTWSVCMDIGPISPFIYRWCFQDIAEALYFYEHAKEFDEIPTKINSLKGHRYAREPRIVMYDEKGFARW